MAKVHEVLSRISKFFGQNVNPYFWLNNQVDQLLETRLGGNVTIMAKFNPSL